MSENEINWAELRKSAEDGTRPLTAGDYTFVIEEATAKKASTGADMIVAKMRITSGPHAGRRLFNNFVLSPENPWALTMFFNRMAALGLDGNYFASNPRMEKVAQDLVGRGAVAEVGIRTWQGQERNEVTNIKTGAGPLGAGPGIGVPSPTIPGGSVPGVPGVPSGVSVPPPPVSAPPVPSVPVPASGPPAPPSLPEPPAVPAPPVVPPPPPMPTGGTSF